MDQHPSHSRVIEIDVAVLNSVDGRRGEGIGVNPQTECQGVAGCKRVDRLMKLELTVREVYRCVLGSSTTPGQAKTRAIAPVHVANRALFKRLAPGMIFSQLDTQPTYPLSTLRGLPHDRARARLEAEWVATPFS